MYSSLTASTYMRQFHVIAAAKGGDHWDCRLGAAAAPAEAVWLLVHEVIQHRQPLLCSYGRAQRSLLRLVKGCLVALRRGSERFCMRR